MSTRTQITVILLGVILFSFLATPAHGAVGIDISTSRDITARSTTASTLAFSTSSSNELLIAFISADRVSSTNTTVIGVTGAGLNWALVQRTNVQLGTAEIWRAFAPAPLTGVTVSATLSQSVLSSITVMSFTGVDTSGVNGAGAVGSLGTGNGLSGGPSATLVTTRDGSLVLGVGTDWDNAIARSVGPNQVMVHQDLASVGDTYWVQRQINPTTSMNTTVTINDIAPTGDRFNLSIVEILPPGGTAGSTFSVSGSITNGANSNVVLTLNGTQVATTAADSLGNYSFTGLANGSYVVTPTKLGFTFNPPNQNANVNGVNITVLPFTATATSGTISGAITPAGSGVSATVILTQNSVTIATATASPSGTYSLTNVPNGTYVVTPSKPGFTFSPASLTATVNGNAATANFTIIPITVSGTVTPPASGSGATVALTLNSATVATALVNGNGIYTFNGVVNGLYGATPTKGGFTFSPTSQPVSVTGINATVPPFTATAVPTWTMNGSISPALGGSNATVTLTLNGVSVGTAVVSSSGGYSFSSLADGTYVVTPTKSGFTFTPPTQTVPVSGANVTVPVFMAIGTPPSLLFPDLRDIIPTGAITVVGTGSARQFQYTHDTLNAGPGPLVIQPTFNAASGNYQGTQYIYSQNSAGVWSLSQQIPVAGVFIFDSDHAHFHFPFVSYGLYTVGSNGGPGTPVATSGKIAFCIDDSFIFDATIPNAGALGNLGSCSDPTSLRGLNIGAVDEYDKTDAGQSISIAGLPDGTYWLKALVDPNNFLAEANKTNNETDVEVTITGNTVLVLKTVIPVLNAPPSITLTSPASGLTISGSVQLTAATATASGVQFLIDGQSFGAIASGPPYSSTWDTTTVANGTHWIAAQTTDSTGVTGTSPVVLATVSNLASTAPIVQLTSPANGSVLFSTVTLFATAAGSQPIASVSFFVDFAPVGTVTAPPYMISWDSTTVTDGQHVISVSATDTQGNVGNSIPVTLNVNNSHPANSIATELVLPVDGQGAMSTPSFSTSTVGDLLIAFVSYDGPPNSAQTAIVSGAGLSWALLERSNTQSGTSEIWSARVDGTVSAVTVTSTPGLGGYHGSLTLIAFKNAAGTSVVGRTGAPSGAPDIPIPGVISGDWVFAVGNDWDRAVARTPSSGQVLVHQRVDTVSGDTFWVQSTVAPASANALVDIHDTAPTNDQWNYAAVEIVATHQ